MYFFLSMLMDGPASLATSFIGLRIAPHFDQPYLTCSLTDFWSRRWNLTAGNTLRFLVLPRMQACKAVCSLADPSCLAFDSSESGSRRNGLQHAASLLWFLSTLHAAVSVPVHLLHGDNDKSQVME